MRRHHDRNQVFRLLGAREVARKIEQDPSLLKNARVELERMARQPHTGAAVALWTRLLARPVVEIVDAISRDDAEGDYIRETMPAFIALDAATNASLVARARRIFDDEQASA